MQLKWSHYRPRHLNLDLAGDVNLEFFVINYLFGKPGAEPWDFWLQCLRQNGHEKLPLSEFCKTVLQQVGVPERDCHVWHPGYSPEIDEVDAPQRRSERFRFLTVTNSHDLERYNTLAIIDAFQEAFTPDRRRRAGDQGLRRILGGHDASRHDWPDEAAVLESSTSASSRTSMT